MARQLRLRDLAGLIVIDFIDMDERKNNAAVEKRMKDKLKTDRARIQVGRISGFGLMEMSRQRLRPGMIEATTQPCPACHGTGLIRSDDNLALSILRQIEEEGTRRRSREVLVKCPVGIANFLMNQKREHIAQIEARYGLSVRIEGDPIADQPRFLAGEVQDRHPRGARSGRAVVSVDSSLMDDIDARPRPRQCRGSDDDSAPRHQIGDSKRQAERMARRRQAQEAPPSSAAGANRERPRRRSTTASRMQGAETAMAQSPAERRPSLRPKRQRPKPAPNPAALAQPQAEIAEPGRAAESAEAGRARKREVRKPRRSRARSREADTRERAAEAAEAAPRRQPKPKRTRAPRKPKAAKPRAERADAGCRCARRRSAAG